MRIFRVTIQCRNVTPLYYELTEQQLEEENLEEQKLAFILTWALTVVIG